MAARWNTLFTRLMVAQAVTALGLLLVFGVVFYAERNRAVAHLVAERWAPAIARASGYPVPDTTPVLPPIMRADTLPTAALEVAARSPRVAELLSTLRDHGLPVEAVAFSPGGERPVTWVRLTGQTQWLGLTDTLLEPRWPLRLLLALLLALGVVASASAWFARRLAAPLEALRQAMQQHGADGTPPPSPAPRGAVAEVAAMDAAWRDLRARLAQHERERALLLAGVSHDLRSPLARIRMAAELLPDGLVARRDAITRNVDAADRLLESFLDHVRMGEVPLDDTVDLAALARALVAARPAEALTLDAPSQLPLGRAHPLLLERLLGNLLDNALRHGRAPVRLRLTHSAEGEVVIDVEDSGPGIPAADRERLMQAFARGDAARSAPGTGLGLAIVQRAVARLEGRLQFSHDGQSHRVRVTLPRRAQATATATITE